MRAVKEGMRYLCLLPLLCLSIAEAGPIVLPASFKTAKGIEIKNARITGQTADAVKVMHDAGIATIPNADLPPEILALLGIAAAPQPTLPSIALPDPFPHATGQYEKPVLVGVDPDGIRIKHAAGMAKIGYEDLPADLVKALGPFDAEKAAAFRKQATEQTRASLAAAREAMEKARQINAEALSADQKKLDDQRAQLTADPDLISPSVYVKISGYSSGGKGRDTTYQTTWGSYARTDVSSRNMYCMVTSTVKAYQRVRMQCLFLTRDVTGSKDLAYEIVADDKVSLAPAATKMVAASADAKQSDENYAALGLRIREGEKYVGWCWRAIDGSGRIAAVYSSTSAYDKYAWSAPIESTEDK